MYVCMYVCIYIYIYIVGSQPGSLKSLGWALVAFSDATQVIRSLTNPKPLRNHYNTPTETPGESLHVSLKAQDPTDPETVQI